MKRGGVTTRRHLVLVLVGGYLFLTFCTNLFTGSSGKLEPFKLDKLSLRKGDDIMVVDYTTRKMHLKEVCEAWGAHTTKNKFLGLQPENLVMQHMTRDRHDLTKKQIERVWQLMKRSSYHQMFTEREHGLTWCKVPKAASTSWLKVFLQLAGVDNVKTSEIGGKHALLREKYPLLTSSLLRKVMPSTLKFMVARHPFERLLSAYRDKLEDYERDLKDRAGYYYAMYGKKIVRAYRKNNDNRGINSAQRSKNNALLHRKEPTFKEFVQYLLDTDVEEYDEHWRPIVLLCTPCHIKYDVIIKMETLGRDSDFVLHHIGLGDRFSVEWSHKTDQSTKTTDVAKQYFSQLTYSEIKKLYHKYLLDFLLFDYDATPYYNMVEEFTNNSTEALNLQEYERETSKRSAELAPNDLVTQQEEYEEEDEDEDGDEEEEEEEEDEDYEEYDPNKQ